jgi:hypothetical protein
VIYVDSREIESGELDGLECSVVRKRVLLVAPGQYWRTKFDVTSVTPAESRSVIEEQFERLWQSRKRSSVMKLYYMYPGTFSSEHYIPEGVKRFLAYLQKDRCPCQDACDLTQASNWAIDHIVPKHQGGTNVLINLQAACREYNSARKRERPEPRTVNYLNIMNDPRWKPLLSREYAHLLLTQSFNESVLGSLRSLTTERSKRVTDRLNGA